MFASQIAIVVSFRGYFKDFVTCFEVFFSTLKSPLPLVRLILVPTSWKKFPWTPMEFAQNCKDYLIQNMSKLLRYFSHFSAGLITQELMEKVRPVLHRLQDSGTGLFPFSTYYGDHIKRSMYTLVIFFFYMLP